MPEVKIKIDMGAAVARLFRQYPQISRDVRISKLTEALMLYEAAVKKGTPYGAGPIHLRDSVHTRIAVTGEKVVGITGTLLEYGEPVEMGTKPHFPPIGPIQFWVENKLHIEGKEARGVAFLIARAISKRGTKGAKMFAKSFKASRDKIVSILQEIPGEMARRIRK